jgi:hypothetical protein
MILTTGELMWTRTYPEFAQELLTRAITQDSFGGYVIASYGLAPNSGSLIFKVDRDGSVVWSTLLSSAQYNIAVDIIASAEGGFMFLMTEVHDTNQCVVMVHLSEAGDTLWSVPIECADLFTEIYASCLRQTASGDYVVLYAVPREAGGNNWDICIEKVDAVGNELWQRRYGTSLPEVAFDLGLTPTGQMLICGYAYPDSFGESDAMLMLLDANGDSLWKAVFGSPHLDELASLTVLPTGAFATAGETTFDCGERRRVDWALLFNTPTSSAPAPAPIGSDLGVIIHPGYPNPFNISTRVGVEISTPGRYQVLLFNVLGRCFAVYADRFFFTGTYDFQIESSDMGSGMYFFVMHGQNGNFQAMPIVLIR